MTDEFVDDFKKASAMKLKISYSVPYRGTSYKSYEVKKSYIESNDTQMSKVIIFDGGIIGYNSSEVAYMKEGFAAIYPIIKNKNHE